MSAARDWLDASEADRPGRLGMALQSVAAAVSQSPSGTAKARMRDASGAWVTLRAAPLIDGESPGRILVTVEPAPEDDVVTLMLHAYALTGREQQICREVLAGHGTGDIADRLHLSVYTVQDHLKSVFAKVGVRSRRELTGVLRGRPALRAVSSPPASSA
jgi:DNA-binding CsgD family transcriptional regulator